MACSRLIYARGANPENCIMLDVNGILGKHRKDVEEQKDEFVDMWRLCQTTNKEGLQGGPEVALKGADVVIALSAPGPNTIKKEWISSMAKDAIVFTCANPIPEIWPWEAKEAGAAVVATGRSDFPNQVNNSLGFPGIFRGTLDVRASTITDEMCFAAAEALANRASELKDGLDPENILPAMSDEEVFAREAAAVGMMAQEQGIAKIKLTEQELYDHAKFVISRSRNMTQTMFEKGYVKEAPEGY